MDPRLEHIESVCECALHVHLLLDGCSGHEHVAKAEEDFEEGHDQLRDVVLPPLVITLARLLAARFRRRAADAVDEAAENLGAARTAEAIAAAVATLNEIFGRELSVASAGDLANAVRSMFERSKVGAAREFGIGPVFSKIDEATLRWIQQAYPWWVGTYHSTVLAKQINAVAQHFILELGKSGKEVADAMRQQLGRLYGLGAGQRSPVAVPRSFRGSPDLYWVGLANNAATTARVFGRLSAMREANIQRYVIRTAGDERVCALCLFMEGREFSVSDGEAYRDSVVATTTPDEYKAVAGWLSLAQAQQLVADGGDGALSSTSMALPSYHLLCRCDCEPVS